MTQTIWKFPVEIKRRQTIQMPAHSKILTIQTQQGVPTIWAIVDPNENEAKVPRLIQMTGTGFDNSNIGFGRYIGTVQVEDQTVWHYFDLGEV